MATRHPQALGLGTNFLNSLGQAGYSDQCAGVWRGVQPYYNGRLPISGCSMWWRRDLLEKEMLPSNIDDWELFWYAMILKKGVDEDVIAWDHSEITVDYTYGTGVTTSLMKKSVETQSLFLRRWREYVARRKYLNKYRSEERKCLVAFAAKYSHDRDFILSLEVDSGVEKMYVLNWLERILFLLRYGICGHDGRVRLILFIKMFFGPFSYALVSCVLDKTIHFRHVKHR